MDTEKGAGFRKYLVWRRQWLFNRPGRGDHTGRTAAGILAKYEYVMRLFYKYVSIGSWFDGIQ